MAPKPSHSAIGSSATAAIVSSARLATATPIAPARAAQAPGEPSKATSTPWMPPPASAGARQRVC